VRKSDAHLDPVSSVGARDEVVRDSRLLKVPGDPEGEGVAADFGGRLAHHETADRLLREHFQRDFPRDAGLEPGRRQQSLLLLLSLGPQTVRALWGRRRRRPPRRLFTENNTTS